MGILLKKRLDSRRKIGVGQYRPEGTKGQHETIQRRRAPGRMGDQGREETRHVARPSSNLEPQCTRAEGRWKPSDYRTVFLARRPPMKLSKTYLPRSSAEQYAATPLDTLAISSTKLTSPR